MKLDLPLISTDEVKQFYRSGNWVEGVKDNNIVKFTIKVCKPDWYWEQAKSFIWHIKNTYLCVSKRYTRKQRPLWI